MLQITVNKKSDMIKIPKYYRISTDGFNPLMPGGNKKVTHT